MKARFLALAALVLGLASCQNDFEAGNVVAGGEVDFQLSVSAPELVGTRAGDTADAPQNAMDSAFGAIDYLQGAAANDYRQDWEADADLRYVLEVYDYKEDGIYDGAVPVKDRMVIIKDSYEPVAFNLRLAPNRKYHFVVFADFVAEGSAELTPAEQLGVNGLRHEIGETLANIALFNEAINDEVADAYFATKMIEVTNVAAYDDIELKRPYGKLRVIATDLAELNLNVHPAEVVVEYNAYNPNAFNAVTGKISGAYTVKSFTTNFVENVRDNMDSHFYTVGYDAMTTQNLKGEERRSHITLFTDYILAEDAQKPIHFTMTVNDGVGNLIKETAFNTEIPIQRNYLTTIIGNVLTTATEVEVTINDNFAGENGEPQLHTILETLINGGEFTLTEDLEINVPTTLNGHAIINLNGHKLTYTIPADCEDNTSYMIMTRVAKDSSLTFVGDGEVVSDGYIASANKDGKVYVNGGKYSGDTCTLFQANGGEVYISGGVFKAAEYNGDHRYTLNHVDSQKTVGNIEVTGGKFYKYNPAESASENPVMNFAENCAVFHNGDWFEVYYVGTNLTIDAVVTDTDGLENALADANVKVIYLQKGTYPIIRAKSNKTIIGSATAEVGCVNLNGAANLTLLNIEFDAANAQASYDKSAKRNNANIVSGTETPGASIGARNLVIDGCKFTGNFANGGAAIAFTDRSRPTGGADNVTIKNCTFETTGGYYDIYGYYTANGASSGFTFENNTFKSTIQGKSIYMGRIQSNVTFVIKDNHFEYFDTIDNAVYVAGDGSYHPTIDASNNTFGI